MVRRAPKHPVMWLGIAALSITPSLAEEPADAKSTGWPFSEQATPKDLSAVVGEVKGAVKDSETPAGIEGESDFGSPTYGGGDGIERKQRQDLDKVLNASLEGFDGAMQKAQREASSSSSGGGMPSTGAGMPSMGGMAGQQGMPGGMAGQQGMPGGMAGQQGMPGGMSGQPGMPGGTPGAEQGYPTDGGLADSQPPMPGSKSGSENGESDGSEQGNKDGGKQSDGSSQTANASGGGDMASGAGTARNSKGNKGDDSVAEAEKLPDDVPKGDAPNAVVARQIREAALKETDPVLREKLWEEYRKYSRGS